MKITAIIADIHPNLNGRTYPLEVLKSAEIGFQNVGTKDVPVYMDRRSPGKGAVIGKVVELAVIDNEFLQVTVDVDDPTDRGYQTRGIVGEAMWSQISGSDYMERLCKQFNLTPIWMGEVVEGVIEWADLVGISIMESLYGKGESAFKSAKILSITEIPENYPLKNLDGVNTGYYKAHITGEGDLNDIRKEVLNWFESQSQPGDKLYRYNDIGCLSGSAGYLILRGKDTVVGIYTMVRS